MKIEIRIFGLCDFEKMEEKEVVKEFLCYKCQLKIKYDYFGTKPPFAKSFVWVA